MLTGTTCLRPLPVEVFSMPIFRLSLSGPDTKYTAPHHRINSGHEDRRGSKEPAVESAAGLLCYFDSSAPHTLKSEQEHSSRPGLISDAHCHARLAMVPLVEPALLVQGCEVS
jgi:hypothetical protein